jgi:histone acetyltransferase (RNA polymerase elongator complex component)
MQVYPVFLALAGCPHRCTFCRQEGIAPTAAETARFLENALPDSGAGEIAFYGGSFTLLPLQDQTDYLEVAGRFVLAGRAGGIRISTRPDALGVASVTFLAERGVTTVEIGCQSFSSEVLFSCGRLHPPEETRGAVARLRGAKLKIGLQLMPGLPGGDRKEAVDSLEAALALAPDFLRIYPTAVFRGTSLEIDWRRGNYRPLDLEEAVDLCSELLWRCRRARVPVIRLGLQGTPALEEDLLAGPWHPAFGQLVRSRLWLRAVTAGLARTGSHDVRVHPSDIADALGHRRENLLRVRQHIGTFSLLPDPHVQRERIVFDRQEFTLDGLSAYED